MKSIPVIFVLFAICGCSSKSPYDVSSDQVKKHVTRIGGPGEDLEHLPPGAVRHEKVFKKGDVLPDGSIATHDGKIVTVEVHKAG